MTWEFRCPCCRVVMIHEVLVASLEELRVLTGGPIYVNSGYRCFAHNKAVGGSKNSYHKSGMAVDVWSKIVTPRELAAYANTVPAFKGIGLYRGRIHVDIRPKLAYWISNSVK